MPKITINDQVYEVEKGKTIIQVADEVGYESEAAFNRAFKKCVGIPPGAWRRGYLASAQTSKPSTPR